MSCKSFGYFVAATTLLLVLTFSTACRNPSISYAPPIHYTADHVTDEWIGFSVLDDEPCKLILKSDSTGVLVLAGNYETYRYAIAKWDISSNIVSCNFGYVTNPHAPVEMTCIVEKARLIADLNNGKGGWKDKIIFRRAKDLRDQLSKLGTAWD